MERIEIKKGWLVEYSTDAAEVTVPEDVTKIYRYAFSGCRNLQRVTLPQGLQSIGAYAFYDCAQLRRVNVPEGVESIGKNAFRWCTALEKIVLPQSLRMMEESGLDRPVDVLIPTRPQLGPLLEDGGCLAEVFHQVPIRYLTARQLRCSLLKKAEDRREALRGFIHAREQGLTYEDEEAWCVYAGWEAKWLMQRRRQDPDAFAWLLRGKHLPRAEAEELLREADIEERVILLEYICGAFGAEENI